MSTPCSFEYESTMSVPTCSQCGHFKERVIAFPDGTWLKSEYYCDMFKIGLPSHNNNVFKNTKPCEAIMDYIRTVTARTPNR